MEPKWGSSALGESSCTCFSPTTPQINLHRHRLAAGHQVTGFSGALHRRYPSLKAAQMSWDCACKAGRVGSPKEWGAARAKEVAPSPSSITAIREEDYTTAQRAIPWTRRVHRHPFRTVPSNIFSLPKVDDNLPTLYAVRFAPAPDKTWYIVLMGAYPGVYLGR